MKYTILIFILSGCLPNIEYKKNECFSVGGIRYEYGTSGGSCHSVCIFEKEKK